MRRYLLIRTGKEPLDVLARAELSVFETRDETTLATDTMEAAMLLAKRTGEPVGDRSRYVRFDLGDAEGLTILVEPTATLVGRGSV